MAQALKDNEAKIIEELLSVEGKAQDIGGYFHPNDELVSWEGYASECYA